MKSFALTVFLALFTAVAMAQTSEQSTAILVSPIHDAQIVRGEDGLDHASRLAMSSASLAIAAIPPRRIFTSPFWIRANFFAGRSLPYAIDSFIYAGTAKPSDLTTLNIEGTPRQVTNAYPLYLGIQDYP